MPADDSSSPADRTPAAPADSDPALSSSPLRIALVSDAWLPQVNGVVRTLDTVRGLLEAGGDIVEVIAPHSFRTVPLPTYSEIRLAVWPWRGVRERLEAFLPQAVHIATEGPLGMAARRWCMKRGFPFTTSYHTKFPEYIRARTGLPVSISYAVQRWFHRPSRGVLVASPTVREELAGRGFDHLKPWTRGVDVELFHPRDKATLSFPELPDYATLPRPIFLYVGRVAVEKNIEAFLKLDLPGSKLVVGGGPQLDSLKTRYPAVHFVGMQQGEALAAYYACADVFVMPSLTETFGVVQLEALASGLPVAAFPAPGPMDLLGGSGCGMIDVDLGRACQAALTIPPSRCREFALGFSWQRCAEMFRDNLVLVSASRSEAQDQRSG